MLNYQRVSWEKKTVDKPVSTAMLVIEGNLVAASSQPVGYNML